MKFEQFGKDPSKESTGVTYDELDAAYEDYKTRFGDGKFREASRAKSKMFRLLDDLVLTPMSFWRLSPDDDDQYKRAYMKRVEMGYRRFWPSYVEKKLLGKKLMFDAKKFTRFVEAFEGTSEERPTIKMWQLARVEYDALVEKAQDIVTHEDVYQQMSQYGLLLNFFHDSRVERLQKKFFDRLDVCETDEEMLELQAEYKKRYMESANDSAQPRG